MCLWRNSIHAAAGSRRSATKSTTSESVSPRFSNRISPNRISPRVNAPDLTSMLAVIEGDCVVKGLAPIRIRHTPSPFKYASTIAGHAVQS
jgi:hypothetical protein